MKKYTLTLAAIAAITLLELVALLKGIDGQLLSTTIAMIAGLGGFVLGQQVPTKKE